MDGHKKGMKPRAIILFVTLHLTMHSIDSASVLADFVNFVTFGSGGNTFTMEFVEVGNRGNTADKTESPILQVRFPTLTRLGSTRSAAT